MGIIPSKSRVEKKERARQKRVNFNQGGGGGAGGGAGSRVSQQQQQELNYVVRSRAIHWIVKRRRRKNSVSLAKVEIEKMRNPAMNQIMNRIISNLFHPMN